jgi:hypothetical protein
MKYFSPGTACACQMSFVFSKTKGLEILPAAAIRQVFPIRSGALTGMHEKQELIMRLSL